MTCEHDFRPIRCIIGGGSIQVRKICVNCGEVTNYSFPHADFDMDELPMKTLDEWKTVNPNELLLF